MFNPILFRLAVGLVLSAASAQARITNFVRPDFQNLSGPGTVSGRDTNPGLIPMQGLIKPAATAPTDGGNRLTEVSFGQPFSPFIFRSTSDPSSTYAAQVVAQVRSVLYPPSASTRANVMNSTAAFRYKWLLFSPTPGEIDVTTHFQSMSNWFGAPERTLVNTQIPILRDALAISSLDTGLRDLLLDCYYDLAVAEMQFAKQSLASLAAKHLGLTLTSPFVIDDEINTYETLIALETNVLAKYAELLSMTTEGVDPADFDDRVQPGLAMGLYVFLRQQPSRNATASDYATDSGTNEFIPDCDANTLQVVSRNPAIAENLVLFSGYKDYVTQLDTLQADFFVGPNYTASSVAPGEWRDKIVYLKVNIIAEDGTSIPQNRAASLTYGGQTFSRTRIPPCPDRSVATTGLDIRGEFLTAPFRFYASPNYDNVFVSQDSQTVNVTAAYTGATAKSPTGEEILGSTYQINAFNQRSVATTRWRLTLFAPSAGWDVSKLKDIEIIVRHHSSGRLAPICN